MAEEHFSPFERYLAQDQAQGQIRAALHGADDGELFLERRRSEVITIQDSRVKTASFDSSEGFGLRAVFGETTGYAHSTIINERALQQASETVRLAINDGGGAQDLAPPSATRQLYTPSNPIQEVTFPAKIETLLEIEAFCRSQDPRVIQVTASLSGSHQEISILRTEGNPIVDIRPMARLNISLIVEHEGRRESGSAGFGGRYGTSALLERAQWEPIAREALRIAIVNLDARPAPAGVMDIVLGAGWPGILLHEAIGHGLEGDFNRKGTSAFAGLMGKQIASAGVTVLDDGTIPDRRGSINIDDEGTPSNATTLIEDGVLVAYMQDRQNARLSGTRSTGNGRRQSFAHPPMPRMTNTYMLSGDASPESLVSGLEDGIHMVGFGGGQVDITNGKFVFSCTEAYRVRKGQIGEPLKGATLIGDGATALKHIQGIGNDMKLDPGIGNCGKAGQWVPVGVGQPSLRIGGLTVGGSG